MSQVVGFPLGFVELLDKLWEGELDRDQTARLEQSLCTDPVARRLYLRYVDLYVGLRRRYAFDQVANGTTGQAVTEGGNAGQQMVGGASPDPLPSVHPLSPIDNPPVPAPGLLSTTLHGTLGYFPESMPLAYLIATVVTGLGLLIGSVLHVSLTRTGCSTIGFSPLSPLPSPLIGGPDHRHGRLQLGKGAGLGDGVGAVI